MYLVPFLKYFLGQGGGYVHSAVCLSFSLSVCKITNGGIYGRWPNMAIGDPLQLFNFGVNRMDRITAFEGRTNRKTNGHLARHSLHYTVWFKKNAPTLADYNYDPVQSILIIFRKLFVNDHKSCLVVKCSTSPHTCCHYTLWNTLLHFASITLLIAKNAPTSDHHNFSKC